MLKKCEMTSDVQSSELETSRNRKRNRKYYSSSDDENVNTSDLLRSPPNVKQGNNTYNFYSFQV